MRAFVGEPAAFLTSDFLLARRRFEHDFPGLVEEKGADGLRFHVHAHGSAPARRRQGKIADAVGLQIQGPGACAAGIDQADKRDRVLGLFEIMGASP